MALKWVVKKLERFDVDQKIIEVAKREKELIPFPPSGSDKIVVYSTINQNRLGHSQSWRFKKEKKYKYYD